MADERVWLSRAIDGTIRHFHCPAEAAEAWMEMGWQASEPPPEPVNPAIAHLVQARQEAAAEAASATKPKPAKPSRPAGAETQE